MNGQKAGFETFIDADGKSYVRLHRDSGVSGDPYIAVAAAGMNELKVVKLTLAIMRQDPVVMAKFEEVFTNAFGYSSYMPIATNDEDLEKIDGMLHRIRDYVKNEPARILTAEQEE